MGNRPGEFKIMLFQKNMGVVDRVIRTFLGALLIYLGFFDSSLVTNEVLKLVLGILGVLNLVSVTFGICPVYLLAHISTCGGDNDHSTFLEEKESN